MLDLLCSQFVQLVQRAGIEAQSGQELLACSGSFAGRNAGKCRAALGNTAVEQACGRRRCHHCRSFAATPGLTEDGHLIRVAAELGNVVFYPGKSRHQILRAGIGGSLPFFTAYIGEMQKTVDVQPVGH